MAIHSRVAAHALELSAPVGPQIHRFLRQRVIRNDLEPGSRISETEVAAEYSVSRQPVREAFIKLAEEGLLEIRPQRGTFVRKIAVSAVMDARFVREAIEADIVKELARTPNPSLGAELKRQIEAQQAVAPRDPLRFMELDERFHQTLAEAADKSYAWDIVEGVKSQMDRVRHLSVRHFPTEKLIDQHMAIAEAVAAGEAEAAEAAMRVHLREILNDLPTIAESRPEFFDSPKAR